MAVAIALASGAMAISTSDGARSQGTSSVRPTATPAVHAAIAKNAVQERKVAFLVFMSILFRGYIETPDAEWHQSVEWFHSSVVGK